MAELFYIVVACLGGLLFGASVLFGDLLGGALYSKTLETVIARNEGKGKRLGPVSRGLLAGVFYAAPVFILVIFLIGIIALARLVLPPPDSSLYVRVMKWSMGVGFIGGIFIRRYLAGQKPKGPK